MAENFISRGFKGRARETDRALKERIPPGQYETKDFPVLSAGPTPRTSLERWSFSIYGKIAENLKWTWDDETFWRSDILPARNGRNSALRLLRHGVDSDCARSRMLPARPERYELSSNCR